MTRFGFEYVEAALTEWGTRIPVMEGGELEDDLVRESTEVPTSLCAAVRETFGTSPCGASTGGNADRLMGHPVTYQTRVATYVGVERWAGDAVLSACGELYGRVGRTLFAESAVGRSAVALKSEYLQRYGIPARMFNAARVSLEGRMASVKEQQKLRVDSLYRWDRTGVSGRSGVLQVGRFGRPGHGFAGLIYARAKELGIGTSVPL